MIKIKKCPMALLACALLFGIFFAVNSYAADEGLLNKTENLSADALSARSALLDAENAISEMKDAGFNTKRATDSMQSAVQLYSGQLSLESLGKNASYEEITKKAKEIQDLKENSFRVNDALNGLKISIDEQKLSINTSEPQQIYGNAVADFKNERYESAEEKIAQVYVKISELEAEKSRTNAIIEVSKSIGQKLLSAWKQIVIFSIVIAAVIIISYKRIYISMTRLKMQMLLDEKRTLEGLIEKTQDLYFNKGNMSESAYHIKINKYGELIRDINRRLPLLRETIEAKRRLLKRKGKK